MNKSIHKNEKNMCTNTSAKEEYIWESKENRQTSKEVNTEWQPKISYTFIIEKNIETKQNNERKTYIYQS